MVPLPISATLSLTMGCQGGSQHTATSRRPTTTLGGSWNWDEIPCGGACTTPGEGEITSLEEVGTAVHDCVERLGYTGLPVTEVMEFEREPERYARVG